MTQVFSYTCAPLIQSNRQGQMTKSGKNSRTQIFLKMATIFISPVNHLIDPNAHRSASNSERSKRVGFNDAAMIYQSKKPSSHPNVEGSKRKDLVQQHLVVRPCSFWSDVTGAPPISHLLWPTIKEKTNAPAAQPPR